MDLNLYASNCLIISLLKSSKSSGTRLVTILLSTTTDLSTTCAPALDKSLRTLITPVIVRPFKSSVSTNNSGP
jgi:hypothetical protein